MRRSGNCLPQCEFVLCGVFRSDLVVRRPSAPRRPTLIMDGDSHDRVGFKSSIFPAVLCRMGVHASCRGDLYGRAPLRLSE